MSGAKPLAALAAVAAAAVVLSRDSAAQAPDAEAAFARLAEQASKPSGDFAALRERLAVLWEWSNARALAGQPVPVDFPINFGAINRWALAEGGGRQIDFRVADRFVRAAVEELRLKDAHPDALGELTLSSRGPFVANSHVEIAQTWRLGDLTMRPGGGLVLTHGGTVGVGARGGGLQTDDPRAENYVTIRSSNAGARFETAEPWGDWLSFITRRVLVFRLTEGELRRGDTVTIVYGDRSGGSPGMRAQLNSNDRVILPVRMDFDGSGLALTPHWPSFEVVGRPELARVNAIAPSVVAVGEEFELAVRGEDEFRNVVSGAGSPEYTVELDGRAVARVEAGSPGVAVVGGLRVASPGVHRFRVRSADGRFEAWSNPVWAEARPATRLYWGDTHGHSGFAEGQGSPEGYFRFGRDVARLDFLSLSEHDAWMDDAEWRELIEVSKRYLAPGRFTPLLGYEWTMNTRLGGHHNVFFRSPEGRRRVAAQWTTGLEQLYAGLRGLYPAAQTLIIPHAHQAGDWTKNDAAMERLVEIQSGHGTFEFFGQKYLENGFRVGFVGASDNHGGHPGYSGLGNRQQGGLAAVRATENTPDALFDALRERAVYATTGERILLDARVNGAPMGSETPGAARREVTARVGGTAPIDAIDVIKNGRAVYRRRYLSGELRPRQSVQVRFESSTEVFEGVNNPRGVRPWRGTLRVEGARVRDFHIPAFAHPTNFSARRDGDSNDRILFDFDTRGRPLSLILDLDESGRDTRVVVELERAREGAPSPGGEDRPPAALPAERVEFVLGALSDGWGERRFRAGKNVDSIRAQLLGPDRPLDQEFSYTDLDDPRPGDYYYVRVEQVDGALAWSSPVWAGR